MICKMCNDWDAAPADRFCGNCGASVLEASAKFKPARLEKADLERPTKATNQAPEPATTIALAAAEMPDFTDLTLVVRRADGEGMVERFPLGQYQVGSKRGEGHALPMPHVRELADAGGSTVLQAHVVWEGDASLESGTLSEGYQEVNPTPMILSVIDERVIWRPEAGFMEVGVQLEHGGAAAVERAEIVLRPSAGSPGDAALETQIRLPSTGQFGILTARRPLLVRCDITAAAAASVRQIGLPLEAELVLFGANGARIGSIEFALQGGGRPLPKLLVPVTTVNCLANRRTRAGFAIRNDGGSDLQVTRLEWTLLNRRGQELAKGEEQEFGFLPPLPFLCRPGECIMGEMGIPMGAGGVPFDVGRHRLRLTMTVAGRDAPIAASIELEVVTPRNLEAATICVDFGTSESGAALFGWRKQDTAAPQAPSSKKGKEIATAIHLGRVGFVCEDETEIAGELFVPTVAVARVQENERHREIIAWSFGEEAVRALAAGDNAPGSVFRNLKWGLGVDEERSLPNGEAMTLHDIVPRYLGYIIDRLERHPDICGDVSAAFVTKPAIYKDSQVGALARAYSQATCEGRPKNISVQYYALDGKQFLISESWSPIFAVLPVQGSSLFDKVFLARTGGSSIPLASFTAGLHIATFDTGGGSLDVSLLHAKVTTNEDGERRLCVTELYNFTDVEFCGNKFAEIIDRIIEERLALRLGASRGARTFRDLDIVVQREDGRVRSQRSIENRRALDHARDFFQLDNGAFRRLLSKGRTGLGALEGSDGNLVPEDQLKERLEQALSGDENDFDPRNTPPRLKLHPDAGEPVDYRLDRNDVVEIMASILKQFYGAYREFVDGVFASLATKRQEDGLATTVLQTGRGTLFPLATRLVENASAKHFDDTLPTRTNRASAKWITAVGGAMIGYSNRSGLDVEFRASVVSRYAVICGASMFVEGGTEFADFSPATLDADHPVGVVRLRRLKRIISQGRPVEIVRRYNDSDQHDPVDKIDLDGAEPDGWLALRRLADGNVVAFTVRGENEEAALAAAAAWKASEGQA